MFFKKIEVDELKTYVSQNQHQSDSAAMHHNSLLMWCANQRNKNPHNVLHTLRQVEVTTNRICRHKLLCIYF